MIHQKTEREKEMKNCGADLYEDYGYKRSHGGLYVRGAGEDLYHRCMLRITITL